MYTEEKYNYEKNLRMRIYRERLRTNITPIDEYLEAEFQQLIGRPLTSADIDNLGRYKGKLNPYEGMTFGGLIRIPYLIQSVNMNDPDEYLTFPSDEYPKLEQIFGGCEILGQIKKIEPRYFFSLVNDEVFKDKPFFLFVRTHHIT